MERVDLDPVEAWDVACSRNFHRRSRGLQPRIADLKSDVAGFRTRLFQDSILRPIARNASWPPKVVWTRGREATMSGPLQDHHHRGHLHEGQEVGRLLFVPRRHP